MDWPLSTRIKIATILMWLLAGLASAPFVAAVLRLANVSEAPTGDDEYMAISFWFLSWGIMLTSLLLFGFVHALNWRRTLQDQLPVSGIHNSARGC